MKSGRFLLICGCLIFIAPGCGSSSKPKASAEPAAAEAEEKAEEPAPVVPAKFQKKPVAKPAAPEVVQLTQKDPMKWELADLQSGLSARDPRFMPAVLIFSMQNPSGAKRATELRGLLERAGQMKDDPSVPLPLAAAPAPVSQVSASKPGTQGPPVATPATPPAAGGRSKFGRLKRPN
jgi:hypothetical protein